MEYMVYLIYVILVAQLLNSKPIGKKIGTPRGKGFYQISGIVNFVLGFIGMVAVNQGLRGRDIIPQAYVYAALVGFSLIALYGVYCVYKMMVSEEP